MKKFFTLAALLKFCWIGFVKVRENKTITKLEKLWEEGTNVPLALCSP